MKRLVFVAALPLLLAPKGSAQDVDVVYQKEETFQFKLDALARGEWTRDIFVSPTSTRNEDRQRLQARPAIEAHFGALRLGVGGEFNYSSDRNYETETGATPGLIRDNYKSRDARVDLAFADYENSWVHVQGGRFEMPVALTEMVWDKDLRPQGGALTLGVKDKGAVRRAGITGLWARGSHVFDDKKATMAMVSGNVVFRTGETASLELVGSYIDFSDFQEAGAMVAAIRRQNTRVGGLLVHDYNILDFVARLRQGGSFPLQLVAEYGRNTKVDENNEG
ncbi:MAG TPA: putative porin, partial [Vicinamibacteria bacterium]|nr:putative porin [Vicinamibacteria bacterium]